MPRYSEPLVDQNGAPVTGALVQVALSNTGALAVLRDDSSNLLANPLPVNADGTIIFNVDAGIYDLAYYRGGHQIGRDLNTIIGDVSVLPAGSVADFLGTSTTTAPSQRAVSAKFSDLLSSVGSSIVGFIQSGTGGVARLVQDKLRETVSVKDFGAVGNGIADDTAAINNALAAGLRVFFPEGTYKITGTIAVTRSGQHLIGAGWGATILNFANGSSDCITVVGTSGSHLDGFQMEGFKLTFASKTGGRTFLFSYCDNPIIDRIYMLNCWTGVEAWVTNNFDVSNLIIQGITGGSTVPAYLGSYSPGACYGIYWHAPADNTARSDALNLTNVVIQGAPTGTASGADGLVWDGLAQTLNGFQVTALGCRYGVHVLNSANSVNYWPGYGIFDNLNTENCTARGVKIEGGRTFDFVNSNLLNTSGSSVVGSGDGYAVEVLADASYSVTSQLFFSNCLIGQSTKSALWCAARDVEISNCTFQPGSATPSNTYPAVQIASPAQDVLVNGCKFFTYGSPAVWKYGVQVDASTNRVSVTNNIIYAAVTKAISWSNTDLGSICLGNVSDNPVRPVAVSQAVSGAITLTGAQMLSPALSLTGTPGAFTATTATAAAIVAACPNPSYYQTIQLMVSNFTNGTMTIAAGTGVSLAIANNAQAANVTKVYQVVITNATPGSEAVTVYG